MPVQTDQLNGLDVQRLRDLVATWQAEPARRQTVWRSRVDWQGGFRTTYQSRSHPPVSVDEPTALGGSDTAANPAEVLLGAVGTCLSIGYALNATAQGIELRHLSLELEGDIDLSVFAGLAEDGNPGYSNIRVRVNLGGNASPEVLRALHERVVRTSPIYSTVAGPVHMTSEIVVAD